MNLHLHKMQGCGNDFLILDALKKDAALVNISQIQSICDRHFGVGADGFVILKKHASADVEWDFYNSDGSHAEMCGNAARCVVKFVKEKHFPKKDYITLKTVHGVIEGRLALEGNVVVEMPLVTSIEEPFQEKLIKFNDQVLQCAFVDTGVPHTVIEMPQFSRDKVKTIGEFLVAHPIFPKGANVTFFEKIMSREIKSTTFERGVNAETLACGTGVTAAAIVYHQLYGHGFPVEVHVPGGTLKVLWQDSKIYLEGPAEYVAEVNTHEI